MLAGFANGSSIVTESIERGLDRKQLITVQRRFLDINHQRLQRTYSALNHRQQVWLEAMPLLFHVNHPMLPGYINRDTPYGLAEYKPNKSELRLGKSFARSFNYQHNVHHRPEIESLFVMGSLGTVAHSRSSDLDIWVCHADDLPRERLLSLRQKCNALTSAAKNIALDCHFFLMSAEQFREGFSDGLTSEASGSTQHLLLLDEFYRTALWLGGRIPLWWLVPSTREQHFRDYRHQLLAKRFILDKKVIDFGAVPGIPPEEFAGAALWQLYKAIEAPYKSVFKLFLLEAYTCAYPGFQPLCLSFKQQIYDGELDIDELDPYILAYRRIEHYLLNRKEPQRLELVRRCLYFKVNKALSKKPQHSTASWQRQLLTRLTKEWGWSAKKLQELDHRRHWKADKVLQERQLLVSELLASYKTLLAFKQRHQVDAKVDQEEFNTLGHKLYACYERRPGKIDWINPGIAHDLSEANLCFVQDDSVSKSADVTNTSHWRVYAQSQAALKENVNWQHVCPMPLKSGSLMETILWCHCNGLLTNASRCEFTFASQTNSDNVSAAQLHPLIRALQQWLPLPLAAVPHDSFKQRAVTTHLFIHVNLGLEPDRKLQEKGVFHVSDNDDALGYGELKENLVKSIDLVSRNSWNEIQCQHFENDSANVLNNNALALCLRTCLQACLIPKNGNAVVPQIRVHCGSSASGNAIRYRVETLLRDVLQCYTSPHLPLASRYVFSVGNGFFACQCQAVSEQHVQARLEALTDIGAVEDYLARPQHRHSPLVIDRYCDIDDSVRLLAKVSDVRAINVVFRELGTQAELLVLDEQGSLFRGLVPFYNETSLLGSLHHFLRHAIRRQKALGGDFRAEFDVFPIRFYKLRYQNERAFLEPSHCSSDLSRLSCHALQAWASSDGLGNERIRLRQGNIVFSQTELGSNFLRRVREKLLGRDHSSAAPVPIYITDLDLSHYHLPGLNPDQWQISHYLRFKVDLEARLNAP